MNNGDVLETHKNCIIQENAPQTGTTSFMG